MDQINVSCLLWIACLIFLSFLGASVYYWIQTQRNIKRIIDKIPGPPTTPILGNILDFYCTSEKLWLFLRKLSKEYSPIYKLWAAFKPGVFIISPEDTEILISTTKHMEKSQMYDCVHEWLGTGLLTSKGSKWQFRRKMLTPAFHFSILKEFLAVFSEQSDLLIDRLTTECSKPYTNIMSHISKFTLNTICETALGITPDLMPNNDKNYRTAIHEIGTYVIYRITRPWLYPNLTFFFTKTFWQQRKLTKLLKLFSLNVLINRKNSTEKIESNHTGRKRLAMLDLLISAQKSGLPIDDEGIREEIDTFMFEGHDTTATSICFTLMLLACHQDIQEKVREEVSTVIENSEEKYSYQNLQELKYLEMVLKESLRIYPSVPIISRYASEDMHTHSGYIIPGNTVVTVLIYDIHHNPRYYPHPEKFDPDRFLPENSKNRHAYAYIPFSAGPRNCIGQKFAMMELKMVIAKIVQHFKLYPIDTPDTVEFQIDILLRTTNKIRIKLELRNT